MDKASKASVHYTDHAQNHNERCVLCKYFEKGRSRVYRSNACAIVMGKIEAGGWCEEFKRASADR